MKRTKLMVISILLALCMMIMLAACGPEPEVPEEPVERVEIPETEPDFTETDELLIWSFDNRLSSSVREYSDSGMNLIDMFASLYPNVKITVEYLPGTIEENKSFYLKKDWEGRTPDLLWLSDFPGGTIPGITFHPGEDTYQDVYELIEEGKLLDLNDFIEEDSEFDVSLYDEKMLAAGIYRGGRYLLPLSGGTNDKTLLGSKEAMEQTGFSEKAWSDGAALMKELARIQRDGAYKNVIADSEIYERLQQNVFYACDPDLVDRETGIVTASREGLRDFCQAWKELFYDSGLDREATYSVGSVNDLILEDKHLFQFAEGVDFYRLSGIKTELSPVFKNFPNLEGGVTGEALSCLGVCAEGENQLNAWRFIKLMLSEEVQENEDTLWWEENLPSRLSARERYVQRLLDTAEKSAAKESLFGKSAPLTDEEQEMCRTALLEVDSYQIASPAVFALFTEQMEPYFAGVEKYEDCVENLKAALREYLAGE